MKQKKILSNMFVYLIIFAFMVFSVHAAQPAVNLGTAGNFVILAKSGISTTGTTSIVGDIGVSPIDSTAITGFGLIADSSNQFSTSSILTGKVYAADYAPPTPTTMTTAVSDMETAYTDAAGRTLPDATELGAGNIGGMTLAPGLYKWGTGLIIPTDVTLSGSSTDVWVFQIAGTLDISSATKIILSGGAQAKNIFWQVAGQTTLGTTSVFNGNILDQTAVVLNTGAILNGRALAQTAVTLDANAVTAPTGSAATPTPTPTQTPSPTPTPNTGGGSSGTSSGGSSGSGGGSTGSGTATTTTTTPATASADASAKAESKKDIIAIPKTTSTNASTKAKFPERTESKQDIIARINLRTGLNMSLSDNASIGAVLRTQLSNGRYAYIKFLPAEASAKAQAVLKAKCEERSCTVELKEVKVNGESKAVYKVKTVKNAKILGFIKAQMKVEADVDAETGEVAAVKRPWWSFLAKEEDV